MCHGWLIRVRGPGMDLQAMMEFLVQKPFDFFIAAVLQSESEARVLMSNLVGKDSEASCVAAAGR